MTAIRQHDQQLRENGYKFLGWMNGWVKWNPIEYDDCHNRQHDLNSFDSNTTCDHTISCDVCRIYWKYDSGD